MLAPSQHSSLSRHSAGYKIYPHKSSIARVISASLRITTSEQRVQTIYLFVDRSVISFLWDLILLIFVERVWRMSRPKLIGGRGITAWVNLRQTIWVWLDSIRGNYKYFFYWFNAFSALLMPLCWPTVSIILGIWITILQRRSDRKSDRWVKFDFFVCLFLSCENICLPHYYCH